MKFLTAILLLSSAAFAQAATHSVTLNWADPNNPAGTTYSIYRATGPCSPAPTFTKLVSGLTAKTYIDTTVQVGTYCFTATATLNALESIDSNTFLAPVTPFPPQGLQVIVSGALVVQ